MSTYSIFYGGLEGGGGGVVVGAYFSLRGRKRDGHFFEAGHLIEVGAFSRLGAFRKNTVLLFLIKPYLKITFKV